VPAIELLAPEVAADPGTTSVPIPTPMRLLVLVLLLLLLVLLLLFELLLLLVEGSLLSAPGAVPFCLIWGLIGELPPMPDPGGTCP